jgi:hypothetical protein
MEARPPCWPEGQRCPNACASAQHQRQVHNTTPLHGDWSGWRMAGADLVSPGGDRIRPERLLGLLWRQDAEARRDAARARNDQTRHRGQVVVIRMPCRDWHAERFGSIAG